MHLQPVAVGPEPGPDVDMLMVGGVVLNQDGSLAAISARQVFEKVQVGGGIENCGLAIVKACTPELDGPQNFDIVAFAGDGDFRRSSYAAPGGVERRVLPETGFVCEEERPVARAGFFLSAG